MKDFQNNLDLLDVSSFNFGLSDLQSVINSAQQIGGDTLLTFLPDTTVLLEGTQSSDLSTSAFIFLMVKSGVAAIYRDLVFT